MPDFSLQNTCKFAGPSAAWIAALATGAPQKDGRLVDKILTSRSTLEGERKQVTVLFADLQGAMELLADRDPEEAQQVLDPVLERMMAGAPPPRHLDTVLWHHESAELFVSLH